MRGRRRRRNKDRMRHVSTYSAIFTIISAHCMFAPVDLHQFDLHNAGSCLYLRDATASMLTIDSSGVLHA